MTVWRITDAAPGDAGPLAAILGDWVREVGWLPVLHSRDEDQGFLATLIERGGVRVARGDDGALGFLAGHEHEVTALYLAPRGRGRGIGKALLAEAKAKAGHRGLTLWVFQSNVRALAFYQREGFREMERTDGLRNEAGLPDVRLAWSITE